MDKKYYVQVIAENYLKNVTAESPNVHDDFLHGLNRDDFTEGFNALRLLVRQLYKDISDNPADFNMVLKEIEDINAKNTDYTNSNASFLRIPNLLLIIAASSKLESDGVLTTDCSMLLANAKNLKVSGLPLLLAKLRDYGFEVSDFGKTPKIGNTLTVAYINNHYLTAVLKSMTDALLKLNKGDIRNPKNNDYFYMMHPALVENETVKVPKLTVDSIFHVLNPIQHEHAAVLHKMVSEDAKPGIRMGSLMRNDWACTYTNKKNKKVLMSLHVEQDKLSVKLNLQNINSYISMIADLPEKLQNIILDGGWECGRCNLRCSGGFLFELDGKVKNKCHCGSFIFPDFTQEDLPFLGKLVNEELSFAV